MANLSDAMREWLGGARGLHLESRGELGWMPGPMQEAVRRAFAARYAGELMGRGVKKGYTHRWIPNRLQDAQVRVVPRSILSLFGFSADAALHNPRAKGSRLVTPIDLAAALSPTSRERVNELKEEYGVVSRLENLRGRSVMLALDEAAEALGRAVPGEPLGVPDDGHAVVEELLDLGVLKERSDGRIDVPDLYRYGFGIKRKGGVATPR